MRWPMYSTGLFERGSLLDLIQELKERAVQKAQAVDSDVVLATPVEDLVEAFVDEFVLEPPEARFDQKYTPGAEDSKIDVSQDQMRMVFDRSRPAYRAGTRLRVHIPFAGNGGLFNYHGSSRPMVHIEGDLRGQELVLSYELPDDKVQAAEFEKALSRDIELLKRFLEPIRADCAQFNEELPALARAAIEKRKGKVLADRDLEASIGIEVRRRSDASPLLAVELPKKRKRLGPQRTGGYSTKTFKPEPAVSDGQFADIVDAMTAWARAAERMPKSFSELGEESLRDNLLVALNNQFGASGAEVFSRSGKTDILIQVEDSTAVFISECKIWGEPAAFGEAVGQLFGYLVCDTRAALVLFIKHKDVTAVLRKADAVLRQHARFKRMGKAIDGVDVYVLHDEGDVDREVSVALLPVVLSAP